MNLLKVLLCLLCLVYPFFIGVYFGVDEGYSNLAGTKFEPLYIFINATTSYFFFGYNKKTWKVMSISLLMLTCFNVDEFRLTHDIFAILFFITVQIELKNPKIFILSLVLLFIDELFYFESFLIIILAINNLKLLKRFANLKIKQ
jgi:hypothetical protein